MNKAIVSELKKMLEGAKDKWTEKLPKCAMGLPNNAMKIN